MEIHHSSNTHTHPKKWKEYFLEFLMIFLAVTLGFIAENIREHITDRKKERQYMASFIRNLKDDTANLRDVIEFHRRLGKGVDSILMLAHANMAVDSNRNLFYHLATRYLFGANEFKSNEATLQQLKSTGDYRLIEKDHVADSLSKFDAFIRFVYVQGEYYDAYFKEVLSRLEDMADMTILADSSYLNGNDKTKKPFPMLRNEREKLPTFFNKIFDFEKITKYYAEFFLKSQLENSKNLIAFLKSSYDIQDD